jgi:GNAT superfamily N-acetyltransferase
LRERFFSKPNTAVIVAADKSDPWLILGWIAVEKIPSGLILQYVYVKSAFKGRGLAKELVKRAIPCPPVFYTHFTDRASRIIGHKSDDFRGWRFVPHLV